MSDGKKGFFSRIVENIKQEMTVNPEMKVCLNTIYRKNSKNWDTFNYYRDCPTNKIVGFYSAIFHSKDADRITNRVDTDKTLEEQSDLGLHCLLRPICPNISNYYAIYRGCLCLKADRYIFRGRNFTISFFCRPSQKRCTLKEKNLLLQEKIVSLKSRPQFWKGCVIQRSKW